MNPFHVVVGKGGFLIVDDYGTVFGSYQVEDDAEHYCAMLNEKWAEREVTP